MSKLTNKKLRQLILKEFEKIEEEQLLKRYKGPGITRDVAAHRSAMHTSCHECGYMMKEGETVCEQCGSMYEADLNEGDCGCASNCDCRKTGPSVEYASGDYEVLDYDMNDDFIPDHMEKQGISEKDIENLILNAISTDLHSHKDDILSTGEAFGVGHVVGKHHSHGGAYMAKKQMYKVAKYAEKLYHMIPDGHNLEDWMRTKLAQISDDISEVYHALDHDIFEGDI